MSTSHVLLGLLAAGSRHGYELKRAHDARLPRARPLAFGQVYATLSRLERDGLLTREVVTAHGGHVQVLPGPGMTVRILLPHDGDAEPH